MTTPSNNKCNSHQILDDIQETVDQLSKRFSRHDTILPKFCFEFYHKMAEYQGRLEKIGKQDYGLSPLEKMLPVLDNYILHKLGNEVPLLRKYLLEYVSVCTLDSYEKDDAAEDIRKMLKNITFYIEELKSSQCPDLEPPIFNLN